MPSGKDTKEPEKHGGNPPGKKASPDWADGLRQLYDSVVDEPIPDSFKDLLAQLDESDDEAGKAGGA